MQTKGNKFYINSEGINDKTVWKRAFVFALSLLKKDKCLERIVFYFSKKDKIEVWFDKEKDNKLISDLWAGRKYMEYGDVVFCAKSSLMYHKDNCCNDIVISFGCMSCVLKELDKHGSAKYIIAVPWQLSLIDEWVKEYNAQIVE